MSSSSRYLIVNIEDMRLITAYNIQTQQRTEHTDTLNLKTPAQIFAKLQSIFDLKKVKAISCLFHGAEFQRLRDHYEFLYECRKYCQQNGIFYYCSSPLQNQSFNAILQTKTMVKEGEKVMIFPFSLPGMPPNGITLIRKKDCYEVVQNYCSNYPPFTQQWQEDMFGTLKPTKIILVEGMGSKDYEKAQMFFKIYNPVMIRLLAIVAHGMETTANKILLLMNEKANQYNVANQSCWIFEVRHDGKSLIKAEEFESPIVLPYEKSVVLDVNPTKSLALFCSYKQSRPPEMFEEIKLSTFKCKKVTVILQLDYNSFYDFKVEPFAEVEKKEDRSKADAIDANKDNESTADVKSIVPEKARMIFDKQNFVVSYFADGKEYGLTDSEGLDKTPIYISFTEKKPIIGKGAVDIYSEKPRFVVFDLIKLCSITSTDIESPKWGFSLSKENDAIIVSMQTVDGEKRSTVDFLLALFLKNGNDRIKKEYRKKMKDIEIGFDGFVPNEMLKTNFVEAGKLLNVNILFV